MVEALNKRFRYLELPIRKALERILRALKATGRVEVFLVGRRIMNKNVLAFPAPRDFPRPDVRGQKLLGEIYLNPDYIEKHGEDLFYMLTHGVLHLLGYDHHKKGDRIKMEKLEQALLNKLQHV